MTQNNPRDAYRDELTHVDESGDVRMVDVGDKAVTRRIAVAEGSILMHPETQAMVLEDRAKKGDVLACARVAGIMASKRTSDLIPMCHPLNITKSKVEIESIPAMGEGARKDGRVGFHVLATCGVTGVTGIEMEALTAASTACLTIYDMCKAVDRGMEIVDVRLLLKEGGRSGVWEREGASAAAVEGKDGADAAASDSSEDAPAAPAPAVAFIGYQNSGKTTLVEAALFKAGHLDRMGRVEDGTTTTDQAPRAPPLRHRRAGQGFLASRGGGQSPCGPHLRQSIRGVRGYGPGVSA